MSKSETNTENENRIANNQQTNQPTHKADSFAAICEPIVYTVSRNSIGLHGLQHGWFFI
jgi:hypothetical protein